MMNIKELGEKYADYCVQMRRYFHQHPEISREEVNTGRVVREELTKLGVDFRPIAENGALVTIGGKKPGKTILVRGDMDALTVQEETGLDFASEVPGVMHACGHDGHTAMLLTAAKILHDLDEAGEINGTIKLLFQPAEEVAWGALKCIEEGCLEGVDKVFAIHLWSDVEAGKATCAAGPKMAGAMMFDVKVHGKGGHASMPHQGVDAITTTCQIIDNLQTIVSREFSPMDQCVLTVGTIKGGSRWNVLPEYAEFSGTTRFYSDENHKKFPEFMDRICKLTAAAHRAECEVIHTEIVPPTINDPELCDIATDSIRKIFGEDGVQPFGMVTGGEDFGFIMEKVPGAVCFVGVRNEAINGVYPNHNGKFMIDEPSMCKGAALYAQVAVDYTNS